MKHIKRFIGKFISLFVHDKEKKKFIYQHIAEYNFPDIFEIKRFEKTPVKDKSVLLIETNGCHGEVISAYFKYFKDLGFNVDIIMHNFIYNEKHFARHDMKDINVFHVYTTAMHKLLESNKLNKYKAIFIMTPMNYTFKPEPVLTMFKELNKFDNLYIIAHNTPNIETNYASFNQKHIFGLGRRLKDFPSTNPHLFGNVHKNSVKHNPTTFITVGGINPRRKNHNALISAIKHLAKSGLNFKVIIVGSGGKISNITKEIENYIITPGRQVGENMFRFMESADFFLPLWDKQNPDHNKYKTTQVSGSPQLIYGFNKIPIVQKEFAEFYDFNDKNSIIYEDDNLTKAMEHAILMDDKEYSKIYKELDKLSKDVYNESKQNIKSVLK